MPALVLVAFIVIVIIAEQLSSLSVSKDITGICTSHQQLYSKNLLEWLCVVLNKYHLGK